MLYALRARSLQEGGKVQRGVEARDQTRVAAKEAPAVCYARFVGISGGNFRSNRQPSPAFYRVVCDFGSV